MIIHYRRREPLLAAAVDADVLLFDPEAGMYFATRGVGAFLWEALRRPQTEQELCALVQERYDVDSERCAGDVAGFIRQLHDAKLIEVASEYFC